MNLKLTDFVRRTIESGQTHVSIAKAWHHKVSSKGLSRLYGLHSQIPSHTLWDFGAIFTALDALLDHVLDFCASILEPNLNRPLCHVDVLRYALSHDGSRGRILLKLNFQGYELILGGTLTFLVLLLLSQGALPRRAAEALDGVVGVPLGLMTSIGVAACAGGAGVAIMTDCVTVESEGGRMER